MSELSDSQKAAQEEFKPFIASCHKLKPSDPIRWLKMGWADYRRSPALSLVYGLMIVMVSYLIFFTAWEFASLVVAIAMLSAFVFIAPVLCIGLYSVSRQLKRYPKADLRKSFRHGFRPYSDLSIFIIVLIVISLLWARAASMIHVFFPVNAENSFEEIALFLGIGSFIGSFFALLIFSVSAFSLPMIMDKKVDMITCCVSSFNAVLRNKRTMVVWVGMIVSLTGLGILTLFWGFLVVIPILGYATWHSYRETLVVDDWEDRINEFRDNQVIESNY